MRTAENAATRLTAPGWCIVASLICAFVTTVDTWLIGMAQHFGTAHKRTSSVDFVKLVPYAAAIGAMIVARLLVDVERGLYVTGLLIFPFLWFNVVFFVAAAFPQFRSLRNLVKLKLAIGSGVLFAAGQILIDWRILEYRPHMPVLMSALCVYSAFLVPWTLRMLHKYICVLKTCLSKAVDKFWRRR